MAKVIQVIVTEENRGTGKMDNPYRNVPQYWDFDGELLAEVDEFDTNESRIRTLNLNEGKLLRRQEDLVNVLMAITDGPPGKRVIRIEKARTMVNEVLDTLK